jgi:hypothetical protein
MVVIMQFAALKLCAMMHGCTARVKKPDGRRVDGGFVTWHTVKIWLGRKLVAGANAVDLDEACRDAWDDFLERTRGGKLRGAL